ncbi:MAG: hemerythrin family protein [Burkholderiales bacterium]|nr:hemerythrin family protein [Burkholderiales bacterium]
MAYFEWADDMVVDEGPIDEDHKRLIALVNELHTATRQGEGQAIVDQVLAQLLDYTRQHFAREEQIMATVKFPQLADHQRGHGRLIETLDGLQRKHQAGSISTAAQVSVLLRDWLSLHIRRSDKELRTLLKPRRA